MSEYGYSVHVPEGYDEAVTRTRLALRGEGFSIVTEMHVGGLLGPEVGAARQYLIMGAWDLAATHQIGSDLRVAVHLPCNVVVQEEKGGAVVAALDPADTPEEPEGVPDDAADAARAALVRALERIATPA